MLRRTEKLRLVQEIVEFSRILNLPVGEQDHRVAGHKLDGDTLIIILTDGTLLQVAVVETEQTSL